MAKDNEREAFSRTGLRETDLCQAAREIAGDTLDDGDAILAAVRSDRGLFALTNRALLLMDEKERKLLHKWPLAAVQDIRVESRGGSGWLDWRTSDGADKESLVGDWSLFQQAVEAYLGGGAWREVERESQGEVESVCARADGNGVTCAHDRAKLLFEGSYLGSLQHLSMREHPLTQTHDGVFVLLEQAVEPHEWDVHQEFDRRLDRIVAQMFDVSWQSLFKAVLRVEADQFPCLRDIQRAAVGDVIGDIAVFDCHVADRFADYRNCS